MARPRSSLYRALLVLVLGLLATAALYAWQQQHRHTQLQESVVQMNQALAHSVAERLTLYQYGLRGLRGALLATGGEELPPALLDRYSDSRDLAHEFPGARGFGFIRYVPAAQEAAYVARMRARGDAGFAIRQLAPHDGARYVIEYIAPLGANRAAIGLDIASESNRRLAAELAQRSGAPVLTGPITLVQSPTQRDQAFLFLLPVYRPGAPGELLGWSYAPLAMAQILDRGALAPPGVELELVDVTNADQPVAFFHLPTAGLARQVLASASTEQTIFGRRWRLSTRVSADWTGAAAGPGAAWLAGGVALALALAGLAYYFGESRLRTLQLRQARSELAAIVDDSADAIISRNLAGVVTSWNRGAEVLFGFTAAQALGRPLTALIVPPARADEEQRIADLIARGETLDHFDTLRLRRDGSEFAASVSAAPVRDEQGHLIGISKVVRDISRQKQAEAAMASLNVDLGSEVAARTAEVERLNNLLNDVLAAATEIAIIATDTEGLITVFNAGAERMLGYRAADMVGLQSPACLHLADEVSARARELSATYGEPISGFRTFVHIPAHYAPENRHWTYVRSDGSHLTVNLTVTAMRDRDGQAVGFLGIAADVSQQLAAQRELQISKDQLELAASVAQVGIWTWNLVSNTLRWNARMFALYGAPPLPGGQGLNYQQWRQRVHPDDIGAAEARLQATLAGTDNFDVEFRVCLDDGSLRTIQAAAQVERDANGQPLLMTGINFDISERKAYEASLLASKQMAEQANAAKGTFLANMSHEIRTPLNATLGLLELLQHTVLNERQADYAYKAHAAAQSLLALLNDILDFSKIEAGKLVLDEHPFEPEVLMRELGVVLAGNLGSKDVELVFDIAPDLPRVLIGDRLRLQQVLINLGGNAVKFTSAGQVLVGLHPQARDGTHLWLRVSIRDTGIGISPEQAERIFDGFSQAEASTTRRYGGTGLGLAISRRLLQLMGCELRLDSTPGVGSCFWFEVPLGVANDHAGQPCWRPPLARPPLVLVVDDNEASCEVLAATGQAMGWHTTQAYDGEQALLEVARAQRQGQPFDLVLMDWRLPGADGVTVAKQIRASAQSGAPPLVIMVTAYGREALLDAAEREAVPFAAVLGKPCTPLQISEAFNAALHGQPARAPAPPPVHALRGRRVLVVEDNALNRQVARDMLISAGAEVLLAEDGLSGVQLATTGAPPDVVLMDMQMPDIDGLEATRRIRRYPDRATLPIIAMTANVASADRDACLAAGMNRHIGKPITLAAMTAAILGELGAPASATPSTGVAAATLVESWADILRRFNHERDIYANALRVFPIEAARSLAKLARCGTAAALAAELHSLKGMAATVGARGLAQQAAQYEAALRAGQPVPATLAADLQALVDASHAALQAQVGNSAPPP